MASRKHPVPVGRKADPVQPINDQVLADREARIENDRRQIPDLGLGLEEPEPATAAEFIDEFDKKAFGEDVPTYSRIVYGPDPLFDQCPSMRAAIEKIGLHDYAEVVFREIVKNRETAFSDQILQRGIAAGINKFGVEQVADAFRKRILRIPSRRVEYEVDRDFDSEVVGSRVLDEAVARYGQPGMAYKFLSDRVIAQLGMRGYEIVKNEAGEPVKVGSLMMGEIPLRVAERRRRHNAEQAREAIDREVEKFQDEAERLAQQSRHAGVGPLLRDELMTAHASESKAAVGQTRAAGFHLEQENLTRV
ncbi:MAG TPA: hypothetical protein VG273_16495 [Bryobacteraceae bacterium]|jgi:hypothetical protein|nr:hypothetical protein [Bryobacteraceae bacterium]